MFLRRGRLLTSFVVKDGPPYTPGPRHRRAEILRRHRMGAAGAVRTGGIVWAGDQQVWFASPGGTAGGLARTRSSEHSVSNAPHERVAGCGRPASSTAVQSNWLNSDVQIWNWETSLNAEKGGYYVELVDLRGISCLILARFGRRFLGSHDLVVIHRCAFSLGPIQWPHATGRGQCVAP